MTALDVLSLIDQVLGRAARTRLPLATRDRGTGGGSGADTRDRSRGRDRRDRGQRDAGPRERGNDVRGVEDDEDRWSSIGVHSAERQLGGRGARSWVLRRRDEADAAQHLGLAAGLGRRRHLDDAAEPVMRVHGHPVGSRGRVSHASAMGRCRQVVPGADVPRTVRDQRDGAHDQPVVQPDHELIGAGLASIAGDARER